MSELVPAAAPRMQGAPGLNSTLTRLKDYAEQPAARKMLPWFGGVAALGLVALTWSALSPAPQRVLYPSLADGERAEIAAALDQAGIGYTIDSGTGAMTVGEDDLYRARMTVASQGALAMPQSGPELIDSLPLGASRTLEGDRLRAAQERELQLTIVEIDGVEAARVHIAQEQKSVFVREDSPPTASVMLRLVRGKTLSDSQVKAIANLVAASVPGLSVDRVRIVDQHGSLLSDISGAEADMLELQARMEAKLRTQVSQLLTPMLGAGNFSSEIQVELDTQEVTSARESYDKDGAVRRETTSEVTGPVPPAARGIPGAMANTPPADPEAEERAPLGTPADAEADGRMGESNASRTYELGREVAVTNSGPGAVKRLSVAVALNSAAMERGQQAELAEIEKLIAAAVGADPQRGDQVAVMTRAFEPVEIAELEFWETPWFATLVRHGAALLGVLLVLLLFMRPLLKALKNRAEPQAAAKEDDDPGPGDVPLLPTGSGEPTSAELSQQVELARRIAREKPDDALLALRRMLAQPSPEQAEAAR